MRRLVAAAAVACAALGIGGGSVASAQHMHDDMSAAAGDAVTVQFANFAPPQMDVLAGDTVTWTNASVRVHTVTAVDGSFGSERLVNGAMFEHRFDTPGNVPYYCTLHPFMRGDIAVHDLLLTPPTEPGAPGRSYVLRGRSSLAPGTTLSLEADTGGGFQHFASTAVAADGTITAEFAPRVSASYRVVSGEDASPAVQLLVLDRKVAVSAKGGGGAVRVSANVTPASMGAPVVLQLKLPQHFGWWPVARAKLDHHSVARFSLKLRHRYPARVVLTLRDGATPLAVSRTLHVGPR
jgi:plastocyanin